MAWLLLVLAGFFETAFAVSLKASDGFSRLVPSLLFLFFGALSFALLSQALKDLPVGTAYAVWTGIGAVGTALVGMVFLGDPASTARLVSIGLIVAGLVGLNLTTTAT